MATKRITRLVLLAVLVATVSATPYARQEGPKVAPRDVLTLTVYGVDMWSREYTVAPDGTLDFPELGKVPVAGLTARQIEVELARRLREGDLLTNPQVSIDLQQTLTKRVTVYGAVMAPGEFQFAGELTLLAALVRAGQATAAAGEEVLIVREPAEGADDDTGQITVNLLALRAGDLSHNPQLHDGDTVIVPEAKQVFITGYVRSPGSYTVTSEMTLEQALALAGGISERGSDRRIEITRDVDGERTTLKGVKLTELVKPGDTIKVNRSIM